MRRVFWGLVGIGIGAAIGISVVRWAGRTKERLSPENLARQAGSRAQDLSGRVREAIDEGRRAMEAREVELRAELGLPPA